MAYDRTGISGESYAVFLFHCHLIQPPAKLGPNSARASSLGYLFFPGSRSHCAGGGGEGDPFWHLNLWGPAGNLLSHFPSILGLQTVYRFPHWTFFYLSVLTARCCFSITMDFAAVASQNENGANKTLHMFLIMSLIHNWSRKKMKVINIFLQVAFHFQNNIVFLWKEWS